MNNLNSINARLKIGLNNNYMIPPSVSLNEPVLFGAALYQHFHFTADPSLVPLEGDLLLQIRQPPQPLSPER